MNDFKDFKEYIQTWIKEFVSVKHPILNQIPCPYAASSKVQYRFVNNEIMHEVYDVMVSWSGDYDVAIVGCDKDYITTEKLHQMTDQINNTQDKFILLRDHPDDTMDTVNSVSMSNGKYILIFIQLREKLDEARKYLASKGYYDTWTDEDYRKVVGNERSI